MNMLLGVYGQTILLHGAESFLGS